MAVTVWTGVGDGLVHLKEASSMIQKHTSEGGVSISPNLDNLPLLLEFSDITLFIFFSQKDSDSIVVVRFS